MTREDVLKTVKEIVSDTLVIIPEDINEDSNIVDDLNADDLDCVELVIGVEEHYGIQISEDDAQGFTTVGKIVDYLMKRMFPDSAT